MTHQGNKQRGNLFLFVAGDSVMDWYSADRHEFCFWLFVDISFEKKKTPIQT